LKAAFERNPGQYDRLAAKYFETAERLLARMPNDPQRSVVKMALPLFRALREQSIQVALKDSQLIAALLSQVSIDPLAERTYVQPVVESLVDKLILEPDAGEMDRILIQAKPLNIPARFERAFSRLSRAVDVDHAKLVEDCANLAINALRADPQSPGCSAAARKFKVENPRIWADVVAMKPKLATLV
jgi:hypothetical protein